MSLSAGEPKGVGERSILDVHMEEVLQDAEVVGADFFDDGQHFDRRVHETGIAFEPVQWLNGQPDISRPRVFGDLLAWIPRSFS